MRDNSGEGFENGLRAVCGHADLWGFWPAPVICVGGREDGGVHEAAARKECQETVISGEFPP